MIGQHFTRCHDHFGEIKWTRRKTKTRKAWEEKRRLDERKTAWKLVGGPHAMTRGPKFTRATCTTPSRTRARPYTVSRYIYGKERGRSLSHLSSTGRQADNSRCGANATAAIDDVLLRFLELAHPSPSSTFPFSLSLGSLCISFSPLSYTSR